MITAHAFLRWRQRIDSKAERPDVEAAVRRADPVPADVLPYLAHLNIRPREHGELLFDRATSALLVVGAGPGFPRQLVTVLVVTPGLRALLERLLTHELRVASAG